MSTPYFDFRRFRIRHDRCAMKVGTDAVLLGAWADVTKAKNILDIGCGSGLITIMAAQRNPTATLTGIEIEANAAGQAQENSEASPYADRIEIICSDIRHYQPARRFDCILSNPPFLKKSYSRPTRPDPPPDTPPDCLSANCSRKRNACWNPTDFFTSSSPIHLSTNFLHSVLCKDSL